MSSSASIAWSPADTVIWHDVECGGYDVDLPLWLELAGAAPGAPVLDVGCGTGRVALPLARAGNPVTAVDTDATLVAELARRAAGLPVESVCADVRELDLPDRGFALCIAAEQTVQLLGDREGRARFLESARKHLRPGGTLACAVVSELESYSLTDGNEPPPADHVRTNGRLYVSRATAMRIGPHTIEVKRSRLVIGEDGRPDPPVMDSVDVLRLARVTSTQLEREGRAVGLAPLPRRAIPERDGYLGSEVVLLRA